LQWGAVGNATGYNVKRATTSGSETLLAPVGAVTNYTDGTAANGTTYYYVVSALNGSTESGNSNELSATPSAPIGVPNPPTISATPGVQQVGLSWSAVSGATSYNIKRGVSSGSEVTVDSTPWTGYNDVNLTAGTQYFYVVTAANSVGESSPSNEVFATPTAPDIDPPNAPTNLQASSGPGAKKISLSWKNGGGAVSYNVFRSPNGCGAFSQIASGITSTSYANTGLSSGTTYCYQVIAIGSTNLISPPSNSASATSR